MADVAQNTPSKLPEADKDVRSAEKLAHAADAKNDDDTTQSDTSPKKRGSESEGKKSKKRRKVNHACVYCRRSHMTCDQNRPCSRCIKRSIGHLCHDEPREKDKKPKGEQEKHNGTDSSPHQRDGPDTMFAQPQMNGANGGYDLAPRDQIAQSIAPDAPRFVQPEPNRPAALPNGNPTLFGYDDWSSGFHGQAQDIYPLHPNLMFNTAEASNEYYLLNDFLSNSLLEDGFFPANEGENFNSGEPTITNAAMGTPSLSFAQPTPGKPTGNAAVGNAISRPASAFPTNEKAREAYFLTAADPAGTDTPEERMNKLLRAKYDAGMLKPFNYVKGYARLSHWMERNLPLHSRQRIIKQLERFRPEFRRSYQKLSDIELVMVEMWFENRLMEYDRIFASMAIPACCWRRTGEIFRGNGEMAELIKVPLEELRDGKLAIWMIMAEDSLVSYWEKFTAIAFDASQKAILTSCTLKCPTGSTGPNLQCCFSFTVMRDTHNVPALIVGNFLPKPSKEDKQR